MKKCFNNLEKSLNTKYGTATPNKDGHYRISSRREGNNGKLLHRLIWEDFYGISVPKGYVIHHKNGNKQDNCILNLQLMENTTHLVLHSSGENNAMYGKHLSKNHKLKISKAQNTSGYFRVSKNKRNDCKQGFLWVYTYYDGRKQKTISSISIDKLEKKVKAKGLEWMKYEGGKDDYT